MTPWGKAAVTENTGLVFHNLRDRCALVLNVCLVARRDGESIATELRVALTMAAAVAAVA